MQRVNDASFFEVTTSIICEAVNGFHNVTFGPGGKAIIQLSVSVIFLEFFGHFFKRVREPEGKLRHVVYEV